MYLRASTTSSNPILLTCPSGDHVAYEFGGARFVQSATVVLDSALHRNVQMSYHQRDDQLTRLPDELPRAFRFEGLRDGAWVPLVEVADNRNRLVRVPIRQSLEGLRFTLDATWGAEETSLYAFYVD